MPREKKYERSRTNIEMQNLLMGERFPRNEASGFNVEELRRKIRVKLLKPIRFLRTADFKYVNLDEDNLADAYFVNDVEKNYTFLYAAFIANDTELLQKLHLRGADVNYVYPDQNFNALHASALHGSFKCTRWLLERGCQMIETSYGLSPLHFAVLSNSRSICQILVKNGCTIDAKALHMAVWSNALDCVEYLLELRAPVNEWDEFGCTELHIAASVDHVEIMKSLLRDSRVDVNAKTKAKKYTALHFAAENGFQNCLRVLLDGGADVNELTARNQTPLQLACKENFLDSVEVLLKNGAAVNAQDADKRTPLHAAVSRTLNPSQIHIVRRLIDRQADVHLADRFGYTALHVAAINELDACVELLILSGANVAAKTNGKVTALNIINRKTPNSWSKIGERLDLCLAYNQEQLLKFSFRDINRNSTVGEVGYLYTLQKEGQAKVLKHPICEAFLHLKWQKVRIFILFRLVVSLVTIVLLSFLMSWAMISPDCYVELITRRIFGEFDQDPSFYNQSFTRNTSTNEQCWNATLYAGRPQTLDIASCSQKKCKNQVLSTVPVDTPDSNATSWVVSLSCTRRDIPWFVKRPPSTNTTSDEACRGEAGLVDKFFKDYRFLPFCFLFFIMVMLVLNTVRIVYTFAAYKSTTHFFVKYNNIVEVVVTVCVPVTLIYMYTVRDVEIMRKSLAGLTLLASWAYMMIMVGQLPTIGTYVAMFRKVLKEFLKMKIAFLCLLMGFTFTFCTLRTDEFQNPIVGFIKILAMMTGELNSDGLLDESEVRVELYSTAFVLSIFMIIITVVLMNLLVGIAVNDVEGLRKNADLCKLIQQTKLIHFVEKTCFKGFFPLYMMDVLRRLLYVWPDSYTGVVMYVRPLSPNETRLPRDVMDAGLKIALERLKKKKLKEAGKLPSVEDRIYSLEEQILKLQGLVCTLQVTLEDMARNTDFSESDVFVEAIEDYENEMLIND